MGDVEYREIQEREITRGLFEHFDRRQVVKKCMRKIDGVWQAKDIAFIDDWTDEEYLDVVCEMTDIAKRGGLVAGAFVCGELKGFVAVDSTLFLTNDEYVDLHFIIVSADARGLGIGKQLFLRAKLWAREHGAKRLYISAHSAVETQAFYKAMGCVEARTYSASHVAAEPCDCQLECEV